MRIPTNHIRSVIQFFRDELQGLYSVEEIENFIFYAFEHHLGFTRTELSLNANNTITESELLKFNDVVKRLKKQEPIQYILGETWFYGLKLKVNPAVLIPRPETEELVDWIVKEFKVQSSKFKVLDVGTGSGCIALALKRNIPSAEVFALDISEAALDVAKQNALNNSLEITFVNASIIENWDNKLIPFGEAGRGLSLIVSNPPYVLQSEKHAMQPNVLVYEPHLALFVNDNDPLLFYKAIIEFAKKYLANKGRLFFEINEAKADEVKSLLVQNGFKNVEIKKDLSGKERMVKAEK